MIKKILIANRGEIALRIIRTCRELDIKSVAVYSEADKDSLHTRFADEAVCIGPPPSSKSYLNIPRLIAAAEITNVDAIHPGYGFLAENAEFAEICLDSDIIFIGPTPDMIRAMGDKAFAKGTMKKVGIPVIPGSEGTIKSFKEAQEVADSIGYPVMIKASGGGGGKGMRIVNDASELEKSYDNAKSEAKSAFGNDEIYIEKFVENPRHIEFQIYGDKYGNITHYGERDCTMQRRHQKLIEESPSPFLDNELRDKMGTAAINGAKAVKYLGAGTIEFLVDKDKNYYFMEMNTRIQVEHPVTELITEVDLVREQIEIADGKKISKKKIKNKGHAIECRINAEDPFDNFRPWPGVITAFNAPGGYGIRVDTHCYSGYRIPNYYDSLISKLISFGNTREEAIKRMSRALEEFVIEGIRTTIPFHKKILNNSKFINYEYDTKFIDNININEL